MLQYWVHQKIIFNNKIRLLLNYAEYFNCTKTYGVNENK